MWKLSDEQDAYQEAVRGWLADVVTPGKLRDWLDKGDAEQFEKRFSADGWSGVGIGEDSGGQGGGLVELALTAEELARAGAPSATWFASVLTSVALVARSDLIASSLAGDCIALLVPAETIADRMPAFEMSPDGAISGSVARVLAGDRARRFLVLVNTPAGRELRLVEADAPGLMVLPRGLLDRTRSVADVTMEAVGSSPIEADVDAVLARVAQVAAVLVAADALGASDRMLDMAVEYSKQRNQFGVPIASFQAVKHAAATMLVAVEAARSIVYFAAASVQDGQPDCELHAAAAKAQVGAEAAHLADTALTIHGAIGYTWEHDLQIFYKRAKLDAYLHGDAAAWNERIASGLSLI